MGMDCVRKPGVAHNRDDDRPINEVMRTLQIGDRSGRGDDGLSVRLENGGDESHNGPKLVLYLLTADIVFDDVPARG